MAKGTKKTKRVKDSKLPKALVMAAAEEQKAAAAPEPTEAPEGEPDADATPETANTGRPSKYKAEFAKVAQTMCAMGATDMDLAEALGVSTRTIWRWMVQHKAFCQAAKVGKDEADERVKRAFYQRCVGYSYNATKIMQNAGTVIRADYIEHVPPDPGAGLNWLANRKPEEWRKAPEGGDPNKPIVIELRQFAGQRASEVRGKK